MASLYKRPNSPYWWVKWRDPESGKIVRESTRCKIGLQSERQKALTQKNKLALRETNFTRASKKEAFANWVPAYIEAKYNGLTRRRVISVWENISKFLESQGVRTPGAVRRSHAMEYISYRTAETPNRRTRTKSTAMTEIRHFSAVLSEAVRRNFIDVNPWQSLGIKIPRPKPKPEISDIEVEQIRMAIADIEHRQDVLDSFRFLPGYGTFDVKEFLRVSFEIAIHQGCRRSETLLNVFQDVDLKNQEISFHAKGDKYYTTTLNPTLIPLIEEIRKSGRTMTYITPPSLTELQWRSAASLYWHKFFRKIGLHHICFHCTRVTCISRLHRAGAPESLVMKLVNHSSTTVHRIYRRTTKDELKAFWPQFSPHGDKPAQS